MARGWDSKAIEDQQATAAEERSTQRRPALTAEARQQQAKLDALRLSRARVISDLDSASHQQYRRMLEQALAHIDREIAQVDRSLDH